MQRSAGIKVWQRVAVQDSAPVVGDLDQMQFAAAFGAPHGHAITELSQIVVRVLPQRVGNSLHLSRLAGPLAP